MGERGPKRWKFTAVILLLGGLITAIASLLLGANELLKNLDTLWTTGSSLFARDSGLLNRGSSADQINVGCEQRGSATTVITLPDRTFEVQPACKWTATDKVRANDCRVEQTGRSFNASGWIDGLDRDWVKNRPGGGHGTLTLSVTNKQDPPPSLPILLVVVAIVPLISGAIVALGSWLRGRRPPVL